MKMNRVSLLLVVGSAVLFTAGAGWAKLQTKTIQILYPAQMAGGPMLETGKYQVVLDTTSQVPKLDFYQNGKQLAQVPVKLVSSRTKNIYTEVQYDIASKPNVITEIDFRGSAERILPGNSTRP